jgi:hypothetical protein
MRDSTLRISDFKHRPADLNLTPCTSVSYGDSAVYTFYDLDFHLRLPRLPSASLQWQTQALATLLSYALLSGGWS